MDQILKKTIEWNLILLGAALLIFWGYRIYGMRQSPPLSPWHTFVPREMTVREMDAADWRAYLLREERLFEDVRFHVTDRLPPAARTPGNRYYRGGFVYPPHFAHDWNRSFILTPEGSPSGTVVLLHGLTDSPYSLRHIADTYRKRGFAAIGIRFPGHGTVPGGLTRATWEEWMSATRLAVREASERSGPNTPMHIVGYSNGAALAMKYALDALEDTSLRAPDRLILLSPMIGITRYARFAGLASIPALLPAFAKTAWLSILPEYNPFKYNSFPVNGPRQSYRLTKALQEQIQRLAAQGAFLRLPPVLTFQSLVDRTVSTPAIFYHLYGHIPENGSELVLFDINRAAPLAPLINPSTTAALSDLMPPLPLPYTLTIVGNEQKGEAYVLDATSRTALAGQTGVTSHRLPLVYPREIFSLSHVAIPFPMDDALYGIAPSHATEREFGINLGTLYARGERGMLEVDMDTLFRTSSNPFFPYLTERIEAGINVPIPTPQAKPHKGAPLPDEWRDEEWERSLETHHSKDDEKP